MAGIRIVVPRGSTSLVRIAGRLRALPFRDMVAAWRSVIAQEFSAQSWFSPGGGRRPWLRTRPFGTRLSPSTLYFTGAYEAAWLGRGAGAISHISGNRAEFGVAGSVFPGASTLRGGSGDTISTGDIQIRVTPRRRAFLRRTYGVWVARDTTSHRPRPHATVNPEVRTRLTAIVSAHIAGRPIPAALTR